MSLYDLPKDILIKLITEIEENTQKKYERKVAHAEAKCKMLEKIASRITIIECGKIDCYATMVSSDYGEDNEYLDCENIDVCEKCYYEYCDEHLNTHECRN